MTLKHIYAIGVQYYRAAGIFQDGTNSSKAALSPAGETGVFHYLRPYRQVGILPGKQSRYLFLMASQYCLAACSSLLGPYS